MVRLLKSVPLRISTPLSAVDEAEAPCAAGLAVVDDFDVGDLTCSLEVVAVVFLGTLVRQVSEVDGTYGLLPIHFC